MNFGNWVVVAFVFFAAFIGTLVTVCVKQDVNLVSKTYYNDELDYQNQINRINNTMLLSKKPQVIKVDGKLEVRLSDEFTIQKGEVKLFCPSDPAMDRTFEFDSTGTKEQLFDLSSLRPGMYKAKVLWTMNNKEFYFEEIIFI